MSGSEIKRRLFRAINGKNRVKVISFMLLLAVFLIFLSELLPENKKTETIAADKTADFPQTSDDYSRQLEARLGELLSEISGVGRAEVIIIVDGSEEYVFAEDISSESENNDSSYESKSQSKLVIIDKSGEKSALVKKVISPRVSGALVVCDGGGDISVRERVIKAVSAALDLPTSKICVEYRK